MAEFETVEQKQLIAKRVPPGDRWQLVVFALLFQIQPLAKIKTFQA